MLDTLTKYNLAMYKCSSRCLLFSNNKRGLLSWSVDKNLKLYPLYHRIKSGRLPQYSQVIHRRHDIPDVLIIPELPKTPAVSYRHITSSEMATWMLCLMQNEHGSSHIWLNVQKYIKS